MQSIGNDEFPKEEYYIMINTTVRETNMGTECTESIITQYTVCCRMIIAKIYGNIAEIYGGQKLTASVII